jgi:hypothetical protein
LEEFVDFDDDGMEIPDQELESMDPQLKAMIKRDNPKPAPDEEKIEHKLLRVKKAKKVSNFLRFLNNSFFTVFLYSFFNTVFNTEICLFERVPERLVAPDAVGIRTVENAILSGKIGGSGCYKVRKKLFSNLFYTFNLINGQLKAENLGQGLKFNSMAENLTPRGLKFDPGA